MSSAKSRLLTPAVIVAIGDGDYYDPILSGLLLRVRGAAASWIYRFSSPTVKRIDRRGSAGGVRREIGLGSARRQSFEAAEIAARTARAKALSYASEVMLGRDPAQSKRAERLARQAAARTDERQRQREARTLGAVVRHYHESEVEGAETYSDKHCAAWIAIFERHLKPYEGGALWKRPIDEVEAHNLLDFFKSMQKQVPHTARKTRQRLDAVFEYALLKKWCASNPTRAIVRAMRRGAPSLKNTNHRALPYAQAPGLIKRLRDLDSTSSRCLLFTVLTAARTNEALRAEWSEIDLETGTWVIPADRTKASEEHRVDLPAQAIDVLRSQKRLHQQWGVSQPPEARRTDVKHGDAPLSGKDQRSDAHYCPRARAGHLLNLGK